MTDLISSLADSIIALINANPRSPTKDEVACLLQEYLFVVDEGTALYKLPGQECKAPADEELSEGALERALSNNGIAAKIVAELESDQKDRDAWDAFNAPWRRPVQPPTDHARHPNDASATVDEVGNLYDEKGVCIGWCGMTAQQAREIKEKRDAALPEPSVPAALCDVANAIKAREAKEKRDSDWFNTYLLRCPRHSDGHHRWDNLTFGDTPCCDCGALKP